MGDTTRIFWTDHTFNSHVGCLEVSEECDHCYARVLAERWAKTYGEVWGPPRSTDRHVTSDANWRKPIIWNRKAQHNEQHWTKSWRASVRGGQRRLVFCNSMSDLFEFHPQLELVRERLWKLIEATPWLDWQLLTKRPMNIARMYPRRWLEHPPSNVWLGTSVGLQKWAPIRIPALLEVPAVVHFISAEPLLGPLDFTPWLPRVNWIITGGESGPGHRPFDIAWVRQIDQQCQRYGVAHFFKQVGGRTPESGGCKLDGLEVKEFPIPRLERVA